MTLGEHLRELRYRVIVSAIAVVVTTVVAYIFHARILTFISHPYCQLPAHYRAIQGHCTLVAFGVLEPFTVTLKLALYTGVIAASPVWLFQLWRFITPGLYAHERRYATSFVGISVVLFVMGAAFAYLTLPEGLHFLLGFGGNRISSLLPFDNYLSFVTAMILIFAVSFELPLLVVMLNLVGILPAHRLRHWWRGVIFGIFVFAAVATPSQDPFTMSALAIPMCVLYGVAVLIATIHDRRVARRTPLYGDLADDELSSIDDDVAGGVEDTVS